EVAVDGFDAGDPGSAAWAGALETRFRTLAGKGRAQKQSFQWPTVDEAQIGSAEHTFDGDGDRPGTFPASGRNWAAELMNDISTEPAPLPFAANLSRVFWVPAGKKFDKVTALPVLTFGVAAPTERKPDWSVGDGKPIDLTQVQSLRYLSKEDKDHVAWSYT